jgi:hypothetical protein
VILFFGFMPICLCCAPAAKMAGEPSTPTAPTKEEPVKTVSVSFRVKRTTIEYAYVQVPVTEAVMASHKNTTEEDRDGGTRRLDPQKLFDRGLELADQPSVPWYPESKLVEPHPIQKAPEPNESCWSPPDVD